MKARGVEANSKSRSGARGKQTGTEAGRRYDGHGGETEEANKQERRRTANHDNIRNETQADAYDATARHATTRRKAEREAGQGDGARTDQASKGRQPHGIWNECAGSRRGNAYVPA